MNKLWAAIEVLQKGRELSNKGTWKNVQLLTNLLASILASVAVLAGVSVSDVQIDSIVGGVVVVVGIVNTYLTAATSSTVGLPSSDRVETPEPGP